MKKEIILCAKCGSLLNIITFLEYYTEYAPGETIGIIKCNKCGTINSIFFTRGIKFDGKKATQEEINELSE